MLTPLPDQELPTAKFSKKRIKFTCSCGNPDIIEIGYINFINAKNPTCGRCKFIEWKLSGIIEYGKLTLVTDVDAITKFTDEVEWLCECGKHFQCTLYRVRRGNTNSCGCLYSAKRGFHARSTPMSIDHWTRLYPQIVDTNGHTSLHRKSGNVLKFKCECGSVFESKFVYWEPGKTCGVCTLPTFKKGDIVHGFIWDDVESTVHPGTTAEFWFICQKCNSRHKTSLSNLNRGQVTRCNNCNLITAEAISNTEYGRLRMKTPRDVYKYEVKKEIWLCECGNETETTVSNVVNGNTKSCGKCRLQVAKWYDENEELIRSLKCPIKQIPGNGIINLETIQTTRQNFRAQCPVCKDEYFPRWEGIRQGVSLTCGCASYRVSKGQQEVYEFLKSHVDCSLEYTVGKLKYDICVASHKILIDFNGVYWHSVYGSKDRDLRKYQNAIDNGYKFISIYEDEWNFKKTAVKQMLLSKIAPSVDSLYEVKYVNFDEVEALHKEFDCENTAISTVNYAAFINQKLVAAISGNLLDGLTINNMSSSIPNFNWHQLLTFLCDQHECPIITYSNNRFADDAMFRSLGFAEIGSIPPTHFWVYQNKRHAEHEISESTPMFSKYRKIWDLGKRIFELPL